MKIGFSKGQKTHRWISSILIFISVVLTISNAQANTKRVAIMPVTINGEEQLSYLKEGIPSILMSRLSWKDNVVVLNREEMRPVTDDMTVPLNEKDFRHIGTQLDVDFLVFGTLTVLDSRMRINIKVLNVNDGLPANAFEKESQNINDVIPQIDEVADEINSKIFGRINSKKEKEKASTDKTDSIYIHPEKLLLDQSGTSD